MISVLLPSEVTDDLIQLPAPQIEPDPQMPRGSAVKLRVADHLPHLDVLAIQLPLLACLLLPLLNLEPCLRVVWSDVHGFKRTQKQRCLQRQKSKYQSMDVHVLCWRRRRCSSALMISCMSLILSVEWIFFNLFISCSLISLFIDYDSDSCYTSTFLNVWIFFLSDLVSCAMAFSLSFLELTCFPPLMEILLPKYSPFGSLQILPRSLNSRLAVLSSHLLEVEPSLSDCLLYR